MHQHKRALQPRLFTRRLSVPALLGAAALLVILLAAGWSGARAAPLSGGPLLNIVSINGRTVTLQFDGWVTGETVRLSYSLNANCNPSIALSDAVFPISAQSFTTTYTLPNDIPPGTYFLCATDNTDGTHASQQTITITGDGTVQPTPGTPGTTPTSAGSSPTVPPGATGTTNPGGPGNQGTSSGSSNNGGNTLVAIILLIILTLALLAYLIRIWLQGRQPGGQPPASGGQQGP